MQAFRGGGAPLELVTHFLFLYLICISMSLYIDIHITVYNLKTNFPTEGVADILAKYFSGHLAALWHTFGCNFTGSMHLKLPEKVSRHLVAQQEKSKILLLDYDATWWMFWNYF